MYIGYIIALFEFEKQRAHGISFKNPEAIWHKITYVCIPSTTALIMGIMTFTSF